MKIQHVIWVLAVGMATIGGCNAAFWSMYSKGKLDDRGLDSERPSQLSSTITHFAAARRSRTGHTELYYSLSRHWAKDQRHGRILRLWPRLTVRARGALTNVVIGDRMLRYYSPRRRGTSTNRFAWSCLVKAAGDQSLSPSIRRRAANRLVYVNRALALRALVKHPGYLPPDAKDEVGLWSSDPQVVSRSIVALNGRQSKSRRVKFGTDLALLRHVNSLALRLKPAALQIVLNAISRGYRGRSLPHDVITLVMTCLNRKGLSSTVKTVAIRLYLAGRRHDHKLLRQIYTNQTLDLALRQLAVKRAIDLNQGQLTTELSTFRGKGLLPIERELRLVFSRGTPQEAAAFISKAFTQRVLFNDQLTILRIVEQRDRRLLRRLRGPAKAIAALVANIRIFDDAVRQHARYRLRNYMSYLARAGIYRDGRSDSRYERRDYYRRRAQREGVRLVTALQRVMPQLEQAVRQIRKSNARLIGTAYKGRMQRWCRQPALKSGFILKRWLNGQRPDQL